MIDTVKLLIAQGEFEILNDDAFTPSVRTFRMTKGRSSCIQNPSKEEIKNGIYKPRLTLSKWRTKGMYDIGLKIEFSAPKLIFGNNFDELENADFEKVINALQAKLHEMHVKVSKKSLIDAHACGIHFGTNIKLVNSSSSLVITTIGKLKIPKRMDNCKTDFRNGGQAIRFHTNAYEFTAYDKVKDLEQSKISDKRSMEEDNKLQVDLIDRLSDKEILRIEARLNNTKKLKAVLKECGIDKQNLTFGEMFDEEVSSKVLNHFWNIYVEPSLDAVLISEETDKELLFRIKQSGFGEHKSLKILGAMKTINDGGYNALRDAVSQRAFYRLVEDIDKISRNEYRRSDVFNDIHKSIESLSPLSLQAL